MSYPAPDDLISRPVAVIGGGKQGRRIALMMSTQGGEVSIFDKFEHVREEGVAFFNEHQAKVLAASPDSLAANIVAASSLVAAVKDAWIVCEAIPEHLDMKQDLFRELDLTCKPEMILASSSSSYRASQFIDVVNRPERVLNTHFHMPPEVSVVEIISSGQTDPAIVDFLMAQFPRYQPIRFRVLKESVGFIFNRIWAAIKRDPWLSSSRRSQPPRTWTPSIGYSPAPRPGPLERMDEVGLDVVLDIEQHYSTLRPGTPQGPRWLLHSYLDKGRVGRKSGHGFHNDYSLKPEAQPT